MIKRLSMLAIASALVLTSACTAAEKRNTAIGGGVGAAAGAIIGGPEHAVEGAIVGGAAGAAIGYGVTHNQ